jgi:hypothetical protein
MELVSELVSAASRRAQLPHKVVFSALFGEWGHCRIPDDVLVLGWIVDMSEDAIFYWAGTRVLASMLPIPLTFDGAATSPLVIAGSITVVKEHGRDDCEHVVEAQPVSGKELVKKHTFKFPDTEWLIGEVQDTEGGTVSYLGPYLNTPVARADVSAFFSRGFFGAEGVVVGPNQYVGFYPSDKETTVMEALAVIQAISNTPTFTDAVDFIAVDCTFIQKAACDLLLGVWDDLGPIPDAVVFSGDGKHLPLPTPWLDGNKFLICQHVWFGLSREPVGVFRIQGGILVDAQARELCMEESFTALKALAQNFDQPGHAQLHPWNSTVGWYLNEVSTR